MEELINLIVQNGIGIVCVAYLIYDKLTFSKNIISKITDNNQETIKALGNINNSLTLMNERIMNLENNKK